MYYEEGRWRRKSKMVASAHPPIDSPRKPMNAAGNMQQQQRRRRRRRRQKRQQSSPQSSPPPPPPPQQSPPQQSLPLPPQQQPLQQCWSSGRRCKTYRIAAVMADDQRREAHSVDAPKSGKVISGARLRRDNASDNVLGRHDLLTRVAVDAFPTRAAPCAVHHSTTSRLKNNSTASTAPTVAAAHHQGAAGVSQDAARQAQLYQELAQDKSLLLPVICTSKESAAEQTNGSAHASQSWRRNGRRRHGLGRPVQHPLTAICASGKVVTSCHRDALPAISVHAFAAPLPKAYL